MGEDLIRCYEGDAAVMRFGIAREAGQLARWSQGSGLKLVSSERSLDTLQLVFLPTPGVHTVPVHIETTKGHQIHRRVIIDCEPAPWLHDCGFPG